MYYRRKILLALIEVFGGSLKSTDCEKLLFNYCQQTGKNQNERIALACFEADHNFCHRHTLIEHLQKNKSFKRKVIHL
jgi:uncharacterized protein (DUF488 family)